MTKNSPAYQNYPADFFSDTEVMFWSMEMYGCYCKLINYLWLSGGYLPVNYERIAQLFNSKRRDRAEVMFSKIKVKFQIIDGVISHKRVLEELQKQAEYRLMKSNAGKAGAKTRWQSHNSAINKNMANDSSSSSTSSSTSLAISSLVEFHIKKSPAPKATKQYETQIAAKIAPIIEKHGQEFTEQLLKLYSHKAKQGDGMGLIKRGVNWLESKNREKAFYENTKDTIKPDKSMPRETKPVDADSDINQRKQKIRQQAAMLKNKDK